MSPSSVETDMVMMDYYSLNAEDVAEEATIPLQYVKYQNIQNITVRPALCPSHSLMVCVCACSCLSRTIREGRRPPQYTTWPSLAHH